MSTHTEIEGPDQAVVPARANRAKILIAIVVAGLLAGLAIAWYAASRGEDEAPYADPAASGTLTFCSADGMEVTAGKVADKPFADVVVGASAAQGRYATGNATLFAYQPREGVLPEEYSGLQLTAPTAVADATRPAARVTEQSTTLSDFVAGYPASFDGYVQLRLILTADATSPQTDRYDAADVRVDGDRWRLVTGGGGDCSGAAQLADAQSVTP